METAADPILAGANGAPTTPRRVLILSRVAFLGGVERILLTLAASLRDHGWEPMLACPGEGPLAEGARRAGITVVPCAFDRMRITANPAALARYPWAWWRAARDIERHCREQRIDLVHAHHPVTALYALPALRRLGLPLVLHVHETLPARPLYRLAMRAVARRAAATLCVSNAARDLALAMGSEPTRLRVVPNGVDPHFFKPVVRPVPAKVQQAGPGPHVGVFAVLEPRKAQHVFLHAAAEVAKRFPHARFWLVGPAALRDKRDYAERLQHMADTAPLRGRVHLVGFQPDVDAWIAAMDVVVQPSVALESFGMALAEAQALGRPVVASRVGGMPEVVLDGVTGCIVSPADPMALAEALGALLESPTLRADYGARGAVEARRRFAPQVFCRSVADAFDASMESARTGQA